ncbi:ABC transporter substrate-binding protein [Salisediminibacterium beveridgei]|uniref:Vitamin B12 ABC transporter, B12-binding component BtuF n=1 Tax=Salisediminibacterium beveridgei TaxID=632773 RepID=A0A1D7QXT0_9BACI|nr:ABC transporter substrate-binding protein [Salisediminibacterium beveridgei]AOM83821.1 Vitamin B12 ABC transporter, B12-binding component BtuF [Salisediminibacterium beveridgei]
MKKTMISLAATALIFSACSNNEEDPDGNNVNNDNSNNQAANENETDYENGTDNNAETAADDFPVTITDDSGRDITLEEEPETLASLLPSTTEILFAIDAGDGLIGRSQNDNYPMEELEDIDIIGGMEIDAEMIISLEPDLLFIQDYHFFEYEDMLAEFEEAGIQYLVIEGIESFEATYDSIELIGEAVGRIDEATALTSEMQEEVAKLREQAEAVSEEDRQLVWTEVSPSPDIFTTGTGTFFHEMLEIINADNAAADHDGWVQLSEEEMVALTPDVIITTYGYYVEDAFDEVAERDGWQDIPAVENGEIHDIDNDTVSRPGPRLVEGVRQLGELIYPDVFN